MMSLIKDIVEYFEGIDEEALEEDFFMRTKTSDLIYELQHRRMESIDTEGIIRHAISVLNDLFETYENQINGIEALKPFVMDRYKDKLQEHVNDASQNLKEEK